MSRFGVVLGVDKDPGPTFICPNCHQLIYSVHREWHAKSCWPGHESAQIEMFAKSSGQAVAASQLGDGVSLSPDSKTGA